MNTFKTSLIAITPAISTPGTSPGGYIIGAIISLFVLIYLIYSLINPEKF
jgi:K+-transporting ATPase KdpF subunit